MNKTNYQIMVTIFLLIIIVFAIIVVYFEIKNDFAEETLEILFPAIGAILLSLYLGFNTIYIKNPKAKIIEIPIAVLHNTTTGEISSLTNISSSNDINEFNNYFNSIGKIERYPNYNSFKDSIDFKKLLSHVKLDNLEKMLVNEEDDLLKELIEYSFWEWTTLPPQSYHTKDYNSVEGLNSEGDEFSLLNPEAFENIEIPSNDSSYLFKNQNITSFLPKNSSIVLKKNQYIIETPNSKISIKFSLKHFTNFQVLDSLSEKIISLNKIDTNSGDFLFKIYSLSLERTVKPFNRFSKKSKIEMKWIDRLEEGLIKDFSWERIRKKYKEI